jgi:general secretion pathway protein I
MTRCEDGFTVLEMLVAMAILSLGAVALLNLAGESTRTASMLQERLFAGIVADNRATEALTSAIPPAIGMTNGTDSEGGQAWRWTRIVSRLPDSAILRVTVTVAPPDGRATAGEATVLRVLR